MRIVAIITVALMLVFASCSSGDDSKAADSGSDTSARPETSEPGDATTTSAGAGPGTEVDPVDQTPPLGVNGLTVEDGAIWMADLSGGEVMKLDAATGEILERYGAEDGVASPDDVALGPDGAVYWTGFEEGQVGRIADGESEVIAQLPPGANPLAFAADGTLYVGLAVVGDAIYKVATDGSGEAEIVADAPGDVNGFTIGADGFLYGPAGGALGPGSIVKVDLTTGEVSEVVGGIVAVVATDFDGDGVLHALSPLPAQILRIDLEAGTAEVERELPGVIPDNLAYATDGTLYVSHFNEPAISVIAPDGSETALRVGA
ncbi:MAG: Virginiamycin B lyase [Acidimicrobiales bacterium]|nr:MAG: hypothetical protein EDR02_15780 [Actinomycetota bacterium]MBV6510390.1 Virginiamycin B lyase [Acidimicrobiales bacterium]RIK03225.1 MAG: hypothetical protein DCC48_17075 [Acidobacteriota bacterium]